MSFGLAEVLKFDSVSKLYPDGTHALADISFSVAAGEFVTIIGPSGCGKSTILKIASGLVEPTQGTVTSTSAADVGFVFQEARLLPWRNVLANVKLFAELNPQTTGSQPSTKNNTSQVGSVDGRALEALAKVGLTGVQNQFPNRLSGGMKMRVSLARALMMDPELFLFDEPFAALDEITRHDLNEQVASLFFDRKFAGLFITHSIPEAVFMSSKVLVMSAQPGRIVESYDIGFDYPRTTELRYSQTYSKLCVTLSKALARVQNQQVSAPQGSTHQQVSAPQGSGQ